MHYQAPNKLLNYKWGNSNYEMGDCFMKAYVKPDLQYLSLSSNERISFIGFGDMGGGAEQTSSENISSYLSTSGKKYEEE